VGRETVGEATAGGAGAVRRLRLGGEDPIRRHGRAHRRPAVRGGGRGEVLHPASAPAAGRGVRRRSGAPLIGRPAVARRM